MTPVIHPIEAESYRILAGLIDVAGLGPGATAIVSRIVHASADPDLGASVICDEPSVAAGIQAVRGGAPVVCDVRMVQAGITAVETHCLLGEVSAPMPPGGIPTRSARAMGLAAERWPVGAVFVVGCAPTALFEIVRLVDQGQLHPALVIGLPVGFVGAAESKDALRQLAARARLAGRSLPVITNSGDKGGSAVAAAAFNALLRLAATDESATDGETGQR